MQMKFERGTNPLFRTLLRKIRKQRRVSARKLAKLVDIHPSYVSKIEAGVVHPPAWQKIVLISKVLESPELLEAGEYSFLRDSLWLSQALLERFTEMPTNIVTEIGQDKVAAWKKVCGEMMNALYYAYERRIHWVEAPEKEVAKHWRKSKC